MKDRRIVLVGMMGAGKSTAGKRLAERLRVAFVDSDAEIEKVAGMTIAQLWEHYGEDAFRGLERETMERLLTGGPLVIAAGGGAFNDPAGRAAIRQRARTVWLRVDPVTLAQRLAGSDRPLLREGNPYATLARLHALRAPVYAEADLIVDGTDGSPEEIADRIAAALADDLG